MKILDSKFLRQTLGKYSTGVTVVTSTDDDSMTRIKESDLTNHISNPTKSDEAIKNAEDESDDAKKTGKVLATEDYQLHEALLLLKGLSLYNRS